MSRTAHAKFLTVLCWVPLGIGFGLGWQAIADRLDGTRLTGLVIVLGYAALLAVAMAVWRAISLLVVRFDPLDLALYRLPYFGLLARVSPVRLIGRIPELMEKFPVPRWMAIIERLLARLGPDRARSAELRPVWEKLLRDVHAHPRHYVALLPEGDPYGPGPLRQLLLRAGLIVEGNGDGLRIASGGAADRGATIEFETAVPNPDLVELMNASLNGKVSTLKLIAFPGRPETQVLAER